MKKIFSLLAAVACYSMVFGQIISVTDGTLSDWDNVPSEYLFKTECAPNASMNGLKSVQVYVDMTYINLLVEVNDEVVTDREWTPFHVFINSDNNAATGGYGDQWTTADTDVMLETAIFSAGENYPYNPAVYKWWGPNGENGWQWIDPNDPNGWQGIVPEGSLPIGNSQMVDGKVEIQLDYTLIHCPFDSTTFTLGFDIQQFWSSVGILPNASDAEDGSMVLAEKLRVNVHQKNNTNATIDGIQYKLTSNVEPYTAEVFSLVNREASVTEIAIPETIAVGGITYTVTSIGSSAFSECSSLTSIVIPNGVTSIGSSAFSECTSLTSVTIPESVTSIGENAFSYCSSLTSVTIPESVTSIGARAFSECTAMTSIYVKSNNPNYSSIDGVLFDKNQTALIQYPTGKQGAYTIPNRVKSIGDEAFYGCSGLTSVTIPESVTNIGARAFSSCSSLTSVTIGESVKSIGGRAFYNCSSLTKTNYTGDIAGWCNIGFDDSSANPMYYSHNFYINDQEIKDLVIPNSVTSIGDYAFYGCSSLTSVTIGESVTSIGENAFSYCSFLTSVTISESVTSIGMYAFNKCSSLTSVTIPEGVASIEPAVFAGCTSLSSIAIPESVVWIGHWAFENCSSLKTVICEAIEVPGLGENNVFRYMPLPEAILYVPAQSLDDYKAADQWKEFGTILPLEDAPSSVENIPSTMTNCQKIIRNGQLLILRDGKTYNVMGQEL